MIFLLLGFVISGQRKPLIRIIYLWPIVPYFKQKLVIVLPDTNPLITLTPDSADKGY